MRLVFLGPPGAGKGTQAAVLAKRLAITHISTGDILREAVKNNTSVGRQAKAYMDKGELVPDDIVIRIVIEKLKGSGKDRGYILDGFPRTQQQAAALDEALQKIDSAIDWVIYFQTSAETSVIRLTGRRVCRVCGANYHIKNIIPKSDGICDKCGGGLYQRDDDREETVRNRLAVYQKQTASLIEYYRAKDILKTTNGDLGVEDVYTELSAFFRQHGLAQ